MAHPKDNQDENFLPEGGETVQRRTGGKETPVFMPDDARALAFTTLAGLLDSGLGLEEAVTLLTDAYQTDGSAKIAAILRQFFGAVAAASPDADPAVLRSAAAAAFGKTFVSVEESLLLSALPRSTNPAETLRAAAELASLKGSRPVRQIRSERR